MPSLFTIRRAGALALALLLGTAGFALADTAAVDGDLVAAGNQARIDLGEVAPGAHATVAFELRVSCRGASHVGPGTVITATAASITVPDDGTLVLDPGRVVVPVTWPAAGQGCPAGLGPVAGDVPVRISLTAPSAEGPGRVFTVLLALDPADGLSNLVGITIELDVVVPVAPPDQTPPAIVGMPGPLTAWTSGSGVVVTWTMPTAIDETDPAPLVACDPPAGATFPVGTTTVTCTATDAAGNATSAAFAVTVRHVDARFTGVLARVRTINAGRVLPVQLALANGARPLGRGGVPSPTIRVEPLSGCGAGATALSPVGNLGMAWRGGHWQALWNTRAALSGCVRITALVDGWPVAVTIIRVAQHHVQADHRPR